MAYAAKLPPARRSAPLQHTRDQVDSCNDDKVRATRSAFNLFCAFMNICV